MLKWLAPVAAAILCFLLVQGDLLAQTDQRKKHRCRSESEPWK